MHYCNISDYLESCFNLPSTLSFNKVFISYSGVLTIAFKCWTTSIQELKRGIDSHMNHWSLTAENMGTKWPKTTIATLNDSIYLTRDQYNRLHQICEKINAQISIIQNEEYQQRQLQQQFKSQYDIYINSLSLVCFNNRALITPHKSITTINVKVQQLEKDIKEQEEAEENKWDELNLIYVNRVLNEPNEIGHDAYYSKVSNVNDNNQNHKSHYTDTLDGSKESTIVHFIKQQQSNHPVFHIVNQLKESIENDISLKDLYYWIPVDALHISIRSIKYLDRQL